jgi:hypothetical protein
MGDVKAVLLTAYATRQGSHGLWAIKLPDETGRSDSYNESALRLVEECAGRWIRVLHNATDRSYEPHEPNSTEAIAWPQPKWPEGGLQSLMMAAFKTRVIRDLNHPLLRSLRGEIYDGPGA